MRKNLDIDPVDVDVDGICQSQTPAAGGSQALTINGAQTSGGAFHVNDTCGDSAGISGRQIVLTCVGNEVGRSFVVVGTDQNGVAQTSTIAGVNATTAEDTKYWKTISSITVDDDTAGAVSVGTVDEIITQTIALNRRSGVAATVAVTGLSGTCQFDIEETLDNVTDPTLPAITANWIVAQADKSADLTATLTLHASAVRLKFDSYTNGAELRFHVADISSSRS